MAQRPAIVLLLQKKSPRKRPGSYGPSHLARATSCTPHLDPVVVVDHPIGLDPDELGLPGRGHQLLLPRVLYEDVGGPQAVRVPLLALQNLNTTLSGPFMTASKPLSPGSSFQRPAGRP